MGQESATSPRPRHHSSHGDQSLHAYVDSGALGRDTAAPVRAALLQSNPNDIMAVAGTISIRHFASPS